MHFMHFLFNLLLFSKQTIRMALVNYSSSSSASESEQDDTAEPKPKLAKRLIDAELAPPHQVETKKLLLPQALTLLGATKARTGEADAPEVVDDPGSHGGRIRSFKHERGNWATYIYIPIPASILEDMQELCQTAFADVADLQPPDDLHISLSRTVVLQYHLIDSFVKSLEEALVTCVRFSACLRNLKVYTNAERTRTFVAFKVEELYFEKVLQLMHKVDGVLRDYKLPLFYEDPSFHVSFLWCLGDQVALVQSQLSQFESVISNSLNEGETLEIDINAIRCKTGNKDFTFKLK